MERIIVAVVSLLIGCLVLGFFLHAVITTLDQTKFTAMSAEMNLGSEGISAKMSVEKK